MLLAVETQLSTGHNLVKKSNWKNNRLKSQAAVQAFRFQWRLGCITWIVLLNVFET